VRDAAIQMIARKVPKIEAPETSTGRSRTSAPKYAIFRQFQPATALPIYAAGAAATPPLIWWRAVSMW
jgi:hypothetical protein